MRIVTDPPFNVRYKYNSYKDNMPEDEYFEWLNSILTYFGKSFVCIHYPEALYKLAIKVEASSKGCKLGYIILILQSKLA